MNEQKEKVIQLRLDNEMFNRFSLILKRKAINRSELIRQWIENYIKENENKKEL